MRNWSAKRWKKRSRAIDATTTTTDTITTHTERTTMKDDIAPGAPVPKPISPQSGQPRKRQKPRVYEPKRDAVSIRLPREFVALCEAEQVKASAVVQDFIADLCGIPAWSQQSAYATLGPAAQEAARAYHQTACQARRDKARDEAARPDDSGADSEQREA
jgi:hypothetical protein